MVYKRNENKLPRLPFNLAQLNESWINRAKTYRMRAKNNQDERVEALMLAEAAAIELCAEELSRIC